MDGAYVLVKFPAFSGKDPTPDVPGLAKEDPNLVLADSRILRKDELQVVKGTSLPKIPDYFQRNPKKIILPDSIFKILTMTVDSQGWLCFHFSRVPAEVPAD